MVTADAAVCIISLVFMIVVRDGEMASPSMQGITMNREQGNLMNRVKMATFYGMRGKRDFMDYEDLYSQVAEIFSL